ncbi:MAG: germination protein YpeB [Clostridiales bacterium]|jgi:germination protein YpeB|nr:germination protein YpeB [Clostridiales bacterium]
MKKKDVKVYDTKKSTNLLIGISAVLLLGVVGMVVYNITVKKDRDAYMREIENNYELSFYELIQSVNDIDGKLGKLSVSTGAKTQQKLLNEINKLAVVSVGHLSHLIKENEGDSKIMRFINQLGDYAGYLYKKTAAGEALTEAELEKIEEIQKMVRSLGVELSLVQEKMDEGYRLINGYSGKDAFLKDIFDGLNEVSVEYPQMIYDGPFSDGAKKDEAKGLTGDIVTRETAQETVSALYAGKGISSVDFLGEAEGVIPAYNFVVNLEGGQTIFAGVTKRGGRILCIDANRLVGDQNLSEDDCIGIASQFAALLGFEGLKNVWVSNYDGVIYVNLAYESDGIIYYPDLVKIKIASDNGDILGVEAANYFLNHTDRDLAAPAISLAAAAETLSKKLVIDYSRLALIPVDGGEILCYEFYCQYDSSDYFVYIDVSTGEEVNILRVIDSDSGRLLY